MIVINGIMNVLDRARQLLNRAVTILVESQRDNFETGWPELNIPPLDPFYIEHLALNPDDFTGFTS